MTHRHVALRSAILFGSLTLIASAALAGSWSRVRAIGTPLVVAPRGQQVLAVASDAHGGMDLLYCDPRSSYTSGYSVDNLARLAPALFTATYTRGSGAPAARPAAPGLYFVRLEAEGQRFEQRLIALP